MCVCMLEISKVGSRIVSLTVGFKNEKIWLVQESFKIAQKNKIFWIYSCLNEHQAHNGWDGNSHLLDDRHSDQRKQLPNSSNLHI